MLVTPSAAVDAARRPVRRSVVRYPAGACGSSSSAVTATSAGRPPCASRRAGTRSSSSTTSPAAAGTTSNSTDSLTPIRPLAERIDAWRELSGREIGSFVGNIEDGEFLDRVVADTLPEAVVHYGEQPSAPYSMISRRHAVDTQYTNVIGTLNLLFSMRDHVPELPSREARHDGRVRHAQHRHRGGLHRDRAQGPQRRAAVPEAARLALPPVEGPRLAQHPLRLPHLGAARDRPQPGRRLRDRDRRDGARRAARRRASTTTRSSARRSTASACRP